jgi:hypothetical protein
MKKCATHVQFETLFCYMRYIRLVCTGVALGVAVNKCIHLLILDNHLVIKSMVISTERKNDRSNGITYMCCPFLRREFSGSTLLRRDTSFDYASLKLIDSVTPV